MFNLKLSSINSNKKYIIIFLSLVLIILSYLNVLSSKNNAIEALQMENKRTLEGVIINLQNFFKERKSDFAVTVNAIKDQNVNPQFPTHSLVESRGAYKAVYYIDVKGNYIAGTEQNRNAVTGNIISDYGEPINNCISKAEKNNSFTISDFFKTKSGELVIAIAQPVTDDRGIKGTLVGLINTQVIGKNTIFLNFLNSENTVFGVDKTLTRVFSLNDKYLGKNVLNEKSTLANDISKRNYISMSKGEPVDGIHYSVFIPGESRNILSEATKRYIISLPVTLENEFKFSIAITTPATAARYIDWFVLKQIILFIFLGVVIMYFLYLLFDDYKENKRLQDSLKESQENEKHITEFFCNMSHELRTPLTIILSGIHFIYKKCGTTVEENKDLNKTLHKIRQNAFRLLKMVNNLLEISKLDYGLISDKLVNMDIVSFVYEITASAVPFAQQKEIKLNFESELDEKVIALNEDGIEKIILNLLSNALKFTSQGGNITVNVSQDSEFVKISIKDDGIGIPVDKKQFIFERFAQVDSSLRRVAEGSGIGLSIVKSMAELYNWKIDVVSDEGKGSEFIIHIPDKVVEAETEFNEGIEKDIANAANIEFSDL